MNCKSVQSRLSAFLDRELPQTEFQEIRTHLHDCEVCAQEAQQLRCLKSLLSAHTVPEPSSDFMERLQAAVRAEQGTMPARQIAIRQVWFTRFNVVTLAGVAACSMFVTFTVITNLHRPTSKPTKMGTKLSQDVAFDVRYDQVYAAGLDATSGVPLISAARNVRH